MAAACRCVAASAGVDTGAAFVLATVLRPRAGLILTSAQAGKRTFLSDRRHPAMDPRWGAFVLKGQARDAAEVSSGVIALDPEYSHGPVMVGAGGGGSVAVAARKVGG